jgi:hypothetical protein
MGSALVGVGIGLLAAAVIGFGLFKLGFSYNRALPGSPVTAVRFLLIAGGAVLAAGLLVGFTTGR